MGESAAGSYLSIGEVLALLLEEFPDVTISKIRFLESQGLIEPERTSSGYRKFYDDDVQLLRVILSEQKDNFLPLRVIRDRLETGQIDPTGEHLRPVTDDGRDPEHDGDDPTGSVTAPVPDEAIAAHPAAGRPGAAPPTELPPTELPPTDTGAETPAEDDRDDTDHVVATPQLLPGVVVNRDELCGMVGMTEAELDDLEAFGLVKRRDAGGPPIYGDDAVEIARPAVEFLRAGVDARHLRTFRTAAEREASLYEQLVAPRVRHRNPDSVAKARQQLRDLDELGGTLRSALMRHTLHRHFDH